MAKGAGPWRNLRLGSAYGCLLLLCEVGDAALEQWLEAVARDVLIAALAHAL